MLGVWQNKENGKRKMHHVQFIYHIKRRNKEHAERSINENLLRWRVYVRV